MQYLAKQVEEMVMSAQKAGLAMSEDEIDALIRKSKDIDRLTWDQIAAHLKEIGYKSRRNGKYLAPTTIRFRYFKTSKIREPGTTTYPLQNRSEGTERTLELIRTALKMKLDDKSKLSFIEQLLEDG